MAGRPRTMSNRVGRLLAQAKDFERAFKRVMPAVYVDAGFSMTSTDGVAQNWSSARDHAESLVECLEALADAMRAKVEHLDDSKANESGGDSAPEDDRDCDEGDRATG